MTERFLRSELLDELGVEHGFGLRGSCEVPIPDLWRARQVHGIRLVERPGPVGERADAVFTRKAGLAVGVQTADCVPLLVAHREGLAVAAVHAGWRGTAAGMAGSALQGLCREFAAPPEAWAVAIGPHIGPCCYEVDEPVRQAVGVGPHLRAGRAGHYQLDLFELNRAQLRAAGVPEQGIVRVGTCTMCDSERYPSFRRDGTGERMLHWVRL